MTRLQYNWRDSLRFRRGLHWKNSTPTHRDFPGVAKSLVALLCFAFIYAFVMACLASWYAEKEATTAQAMLMDCLNGRSTLYVENNSSYGHGRTYLTCRVEEVDV